MASRSSFKDIKHEIERRIADREWGPGSLIPGEEDLAREFGSARATVNRALQELARAGVVERKRKAGTRVALHPLREAHFVIPLVRQEIEAEGAIYGYRLLSRNIAAAPELVRAKLDLTAARKLLHLRCLHLADGTPWQYEDRWINIAAVPTIRDADFSMTGPNEWLVINSPFSRADFVFKAARAREDDAALLQILPGDAVFVGERTTWIGTMPVTFVRMVHPSSYELRTTL